MYWIDELSGYVSEVTRVCYPAVESESIHGQEYEPRTRITDGELVDNERNSVSGLDVEFTSGSPLVSAAGTLVGYDGIAASYAYFSPDTDIPYESDSLSSYILVRGKETRAPQLFLMNIIRRSNENSIQFAHRGGFYSKSSDIHPESPSGTSRPTAMRFSTPASSMTRQMKPTLRHRNSR